MARLTRSEQSLLVSWMSGLENERVYPAAAGVLRVSCADYRLIYDDRLIAIRDDDGNIYALDVASGSGEGRWVSGAINIAQEYGSRYQFVAPHYDDHTQPVLPADLVLSSTLCKQPSTYLTILHPDLFGWMGNPPEGDHR